MLEQEIQHVLLNQISGIKFGGVFLFYSVMFSLSFYKHRRYTYKIILVQYYRTIKHIVLFDV